MRGGSAWSGDRPRGDVPKLDFDTDVNVETLGDVGTANVDPLVIGFSLGYQF